MKSLPTINTHPFAVCFICHCHCHASLQAAIAFDHSMIEALLKAGTINLGLAQDVYERGVSSMSYAELTLEEPLATALEKGTLVMGTSVNGTQARGTLMEPYSDGSQVIKVVYEVSDVQDSYVNCRVGGAPEPYMILEGCKYAMDGPNDCLPVLPPLMLDLAIIFADVVH